MFSQQIFSNRVKNLRLSNNISQKQLGSVIGLSLQAVSDIERCKRLTTIDKLVEMAYYFNVSTDYLLGVSDDPEIHTLNIE